MSKAKYYIYRNLHKDCFSVRYKGKVIDHCKTLIAYGVEFKVNQKGRERVLKERRKNVHAFVVAGGYMETEVDLDGTSETYYNPYKQDQFTYNGEPIDTAPWAILTGNKIYIKENSNGSI